MLKQLLAEGKDVPRIAGLITDAGYDCSERQIHRWKLRHGLRQFWRGSDAQLDAVVQTLQSNDELGPKEGHAWLHAVVNAEIPNGQRVGRGRFCASLRRCDPAGADARKEMVKARTTRRVYVADYEL